MEELKDFGTFLNTIPVAVEEKLAEAGGGEAVSHGIWARDHQPLS